MLWSLEPIKQLFSKDSYAQMFLTLQSIQNVGSGEMLQKTPITVMHEPFITKLKNT